jgi:4-oxalomesaconate tautomerase
VASPLAQLAAGSGACEVVIEHPAGKIAATVQPDGNGGVVSAGIVRTARPLFNGQVYARVVQDLQMAA